jgi:uncharacterized Zn-binding protein involved in type VI secretion
MNVVRKGDKVDCNDASAEGTKTVFVNNIPVATKGYPSTTGHDGWPPTVFISNFAKTVFFENQPVVLKGKTKIQPHRKRSSSHDGTASTASPNVEAEA